MGINGLLRLIGKNSDVEKKTLHASSIRDDMFSNFADNSVNEDSSVVMNTEERVVDNVMNVITDDDLHQKVRQKERLATIRSRRRPD